MSRLQQQSELLPGEVILARHGADAVVLTNFRVWQESRSGHNNIVRTVMLEDVSSCSIRRHRRQWLYIAAIALGITALLCLVTPTVFAPADQTGGPSAEAPSQQPASLGRVKAIGVCSLFGSAILGFWFMATREAEMRINPAGGESIATISGYDDDTLMRQFILTLQVAKNARFLKRPAG